MYPTTASAAVPDSPGGQVYAGLAIYDTMQFIAPDVQTVCCGVAMSYRRAVPGRRATSMPARRSRLRRRLDELFAQHTGLALGPRPRRHGLRDRYFTPAEALDYGLVDRVMNGRASPNGG